MRGIDYKDTGRPEGAKVRKTCQPEIESCSHSGLKLVLVRMLLEVPSLLTSRNLGCWMPIAAPGVTCCHPLSLATIAAPIRSSMESLLLSSCLPIFLQNVLQS